MTSAFLLDLQSSFASAAFSVLTGLVSYLPVLLASIIVFLVGLALANWSRTLTTRVLGLLHLSELLGARGFKQFLENADITAKIETVIGELVRYLVILIFAIASINLLGLNTVTQVLNSLLGYLPNIFAAALIFGSGVVLAGFLEKVVKGSFGGIDLRLSRLLAKIVSYLVVTFAILASISQLGIAKNLIDTIFVGFIAMFALAFGLSLGLGSKDLVKSLFEEWYHGLKKELKN